MRWHLQKRLLKVTWLKAASALKAILQSLTRHGLKRVMRLLVKLSFQKAKTQLKRLLPRKLLLKRQKSKRSVSQTVILERRPSGRLFHFRGCTHE